MDIDPSFSLHKQSKPVEVSFVEDLDITVDRKFLDRKQKSKLFRMKRR